MSSVVELNDMPETAAMMARSGETFRRLVEHCRLPYGAVLIGFDDLGDIIVGLDGSGKFHPLARLLTEDERQKAELILTDPESPNAGRA